MKMASQEPEPDGNKTMSCPDDAATFAASLVEQVNREDIPQMVYIQRDMLGRFEKTNEMLINFNMLSAARYEATLKEFQKHTQLLFDMKKDLNGIFRRIRVVKSRLEKSYPDAFAACSHTYTVASDDEEDEDNGYGDGAYHTLRNVVNNDTSGILKSGATAADNNQVDGHRLFLHGSQGARAQQEPSVSKFAGPVVNVASSENDPDTSQASKEKSNNISLPPKS